MSQRYRGLRSMRFAAVRVCRSFTSLKNSQQQHHQADEKGNVDQSSHLSLQKHGASVAAPIAVFESRETGAEARRVIVPGTASS
jgi:hypothetical protein